MADMSLPPIHLIVAITNQGGIGRKGKLPFRIPEDMEYFKNITTVTRDPLKKNCCIMGRKTYESIPPKFRPLPGRFTIVLSRNSADTKSVLGIDGNDVAVCKSLVDAVEMAKTMQSCIETIFICGGADVYSQCLGSTVKCSKLYITTVDSDMECDTFFDKDKVSEDNGYSLESETDIMESSTKMKYRFQIYTPNKWFNRIQKPDQKGNISRESWTLYPYTPQDPQELKRLVGKCNRPKTDPPTNQSTSETTATTFYSDYRSGIPVSEIRIKGAPGEKTLCALNFQPPTYDDRLLLMKQLSIVPVQGGNRDEEKEKLRAYLQKLGLLKQDEPIPDHFLESIDQGPFITKENN
jgi:dihydrofolate reductase